MNRSRSLVAFLVLGGLSACDQAVGRARPQLIVVVDTDAHVAGELSSHAEVSGDATLDALRVDVLDSSGKTLDLRTFLVADPSNWPLSFGVVASDASPSEVRLRLRAFRAQFAVPTTELGVPTLDPSAPVTIERYVRLPLPSAAVSHVLVRLAEDCMGAASSFAAPETTCVDLAHPAGDPQQGALSLDGDALVSTVGSWRPAFSVPCGVTPSGDQVCIPGGFTIVGDRDTVGSGQRPSYEPVPLRPVVLSPFFLDAHEFTIGRLRALMRAGRLDGPELVAGDPANDVDRFCTWLGPDDPTNDDLPVNCVAYATAAAACAAEGGYLPTEAQWEHAARGRGQRRLFPWGNEPPRCCAASVSRTGARSEGALAECGPGSGPEPVGAHGAGSACGGLGDVTRDGVFDMAGSVTEALQDDFSGYDSPCWASVAILHDPLCRVPDSIPSARGGYWNSGLSTLLLPLRNRYVQGPGQGFRCAYAASL